MTIRNFTKTFIVSAIVPAVISGCFRDLGNYDYIEVNEAVISDKGFESPYDVRTNVDILKIEPEISFTTDPEGTGDYSYEWVAVGQNFLRGQRFVIGTEKDLYYPVKLQAEEYILYLKVRDNGTGIVFSKDVGLNVRSTYSLGWLLGGTDENGGGQVDMMSISSDTLFIHNTLVAEEGLVLSPVSLVWVDNDEWTSEERLYVATEDGTYKFDRENFNGSPYTDIRYSFAIDPQTGQYLMSDSQKISDKRHVVIVDNQAYIVSSSGGMIENSFCTYDNMSYFDVAPKMLCNHRQKDIRTFIFYNQDEREFCYISGLSVKNMKFMGDAEEDTYSWDTKNDFAGGLDFVTAVNSFFSNGQAAAILRNPADGRHYIYCTTPDNSGTISKDGRYEVDAVATDFGNAVSYAITVNHGYMVYACGNTLYGYDFRKTPQTCTVLRTFDAPVTFLMSDIESPEQYDDFLYVATYDDSVPRSGILYKFKVEDSPDRIAVEETEKWDEGLLKIAAMKYKAF